MAIHHFGGGRDNWEDAEAVDWRTIRARRPHAAAKCGGFAQERLESEAEIAGYIAQLTAEMGQMAQSARFDLLAYFLSLAKLEAETIQRRPIMDEFGSP